MRRKLLYIMSVDWNWIAQRPHFLALELDKYFDVTVAYPRFLYRPWKGQEHVKAPGKCLGVPQIPFQERSNVLRDLGTLVFRGYVGNLNSYDFVWLGTPMFARLLPKGYSGTVIYDYMDDIAALQSDSSVAEYVKKAHRKLLVRADHIFVTSDYLMSGLEKKYRKKASLLRNAFRDQSTADGSRKRKSISKKDFLENYSTANVKKNRSGKKEPEKTGDRIRLGYVGTISAWMDFKLLLDSLDRFSKIEYHLWGPAGISIPVHERIFYHNVIEHDQIEDAVNGLDCLIMPFIVNQVVLAVDPVKLYEYISFGKNIISVHYPEVARFEPYIWFYESEKEFFELLQDLIINKLKIKYDRKMQQAFLAENSWNERGQEAARVLNHLRGSHTV